VQVLKDVCAPGAIILLSTFDRRVGTPEAVAGGPPFSIPPEEVERLFKDIGTITKVDEIDLFNSTDANNKDMAARFKKNGLDDLREGVYVIKVNEGGAFEWLKKTFCPA